EQSTTAEYRSRSAAHCVTERAMSALVCRTEPPPCRPQETVTGFSAFPAPRFRRSCVCAPLCVRAWLRMARPESRPDRVRRAGPGDIHRSRYIWMVCPAKACAATARADCAVDLACVPCVKAPDCTPPPGQQRSRATGAGVERSRDTDTRDRAHARLERPARGC